MKTIDSSYITSLPSSLLLIGAPGSGKTTLAMQFPDTFILDCDGNLDGSIRYLRSQSLLPTNLYYDSPVIGQNGLPIPRGERYAVAAGMLKAAFEEPKIKTVVIDSLTVYVQMALDHVRMLQKRGFGDGVKTVDPGLQQQDWGVFKALLQESILWMKSPGKTLIFTAHFEVSEDELTKQLYKKLSMPGSMQNVFSGYFQEVWECYTEMKGAGATATAERMIRTTPTNREAFLGLKTSVGLRPTEPMKMAELIKKFKAA